LRVQVATIDPRGASGSFDLVVTTTDLAVPRNVRGVPMVLVRGGHDRP
jgi:hypothetical protein